MTELPTFPPPPGVIANFENPYSLQIYDIVCQAVCFTLTTLLLCVRLYTKVRVLRHAGWDDCKLVLALRLPWLTTMDRCFRARMGESCLQVASLDTMSTDSSMQVGLTTYMIINLEEDKYGNGRHLWNIRGSEVTKYAQVCQVMLEH
jgi:hypothetical protein